MRSKEQSMKDSYVPEADGSALVKRLALASPF